MGGLCAKLDRIGQVGELEPKVRRRRLRLLFFLLSAITLIINLDGGGVPAALINIQYTYNLEAWQLGLLGALVYVGQASGSIACGPLLKKYSPTRVCQAALVLNTLATFTFAMSNSSGMLLTARFAIGLLQAAPAVYFPVWVDEFGPEKSRTVWMAAIQAGAPLGIMCGYVLAGLLTQDESDTVGWRVPFFLQSGVLLGFTLISPLLPKALFDLQAPDNAGTISIVQGPGDFVHIDVSSGEEKSVALSPPPPPLPPSPPPSPSENQIADTPPTKRSSSATLGGMRPRHRRTESGEGLLPSLANAQTSSAEAIEPLEPSAGHTPSVSSAPGSLPASRTAEGHSTAAVVVENVAVRLDHVPEGEEEEPAEFIAGLSSLITRTPVGAITVEQHSVTGRQRLNHGALLIESLSARDEDSGRDDDADVPAGRAATAAPSTPMSSVVSEGSQAPPAKAKPMSTRKAAKKLMRNPTYMYTCFSLAALFFVVTGIQFWVTSYLVDVLGAPKNEVVAAFAIVSITMPILGVAVGSLIVDKLGGYQGDVGIARTLKICAIFATIAALAALSTCFVPPAEGAFVTVVALICVTLFFGGCVIPSATGVLMEVAVPEARAVASAGSMFCFQLFGYALSPLVSAIVMQIGAGVADHDAPAGLVNLNVTTNMSTAANATSGSHDVEITPYQLTLGFRTVMAWGLLGAVLMILAWRAAARNLTAAARRVGAAEAQHQRELATQRA